MTGKQPVNGALCHPRTLNVWYQHMLAVIFEVIPTPEGKEEYFQTAAHLRSFLEKQEGFISIERFQSVTAKEKILSLSFWEDEAAVLKWRNLLEHRMAQKQGRTALFRSYRIRVAEVVRDYTDARRAEAPADSKDALG